MRACGCGLRMTLPQIMPGIVVSAAKAARPVTLSAPSGRMVRWPIHLLLVMMFIAPSPACRPRSQEPREQSCRSRCTGRDCRRARSGPLPRSAREFFASSAAEATSMPEVQMPHCSAAISRNFCCNGCSFSPCAMPSMVLMSWPSASADSIRQEQTSRSSSMMLQAPQSPEAQPSFEPVNAKRPAQGVEHGVVRLAQELDGLAVDGGGDVQFCHGR